MRTLLAQVKKSERWLAFAVGVRPQSLNHWLKEDYSPRDDRVWFRMLDVLNKHERSLDLPEPDVPAQMGEPVAPYKAEQLDRPRAIATAFSAQMRYAGEVPCNVEWGNPLAAEEVLEVDAQYDHPRRFAAKVVGESCYPALEPGDITIFHNDMNPPYGTIVLAQRKDDHGVTVKLLEWDPDAQQPRLTPVNPAYKAPEEGEGWHVIARLVAVLRASEAPKRTWFWEPGLRPKHLDR
ncbi:MAG: S24 family peptidase [Armatimonadetes bacterium]|nr:S24 family peptidase [Armatimonadota bacterium]